MKTVEYSIKGMTCTGCSSSVKRVLDRQQAIKSAEVSLENEMAKVTYDEHEIDDQQIINLINRLDFKASLK
ncbi:cation transporter [Mycoplasmatota bacterium]|nr:cation transporter [Mycoplasmatota bacterium]